MFWITPGRRWLSINNISILEYLFHGCPDPVELWVSWFIVQEFSSLPDVLVRSKNAINRDWAMVAAIICIVSIVAK